MTAAFAPVEEIVSNESPMKSLFSLFNSQLIRPERQEMRDNVSHLRKSSSLVAASYSVQLSPFSSASSNQARYRTRAAPSRI